MRYVLIQDSYKNDFSRRVCDNSYEDDLSINTTVIVILWTAEVINQYFSQTLKQMFVIKVNCNASL